MTTVQEPVAHPPLLSQRNFSFLLISRTLSMASFQMLGVVMGWQMYDKTGSVLNLGLVGLFLFLPRALLILHAGHVVDRYSRRLVMAAAQSLHALVMALLLIMTLANYFHRDLVFLLLFLLGTAKAFEFPANQALMPSLVPSAQLPQAIAYSSAASQIAIVVAPTLGGWIYLSGPANSYGCCLLLSISCALFTLAIRYRRQSAGVNDASTKALLAGIAYMRSQPVVLGAITLDLFAVLLGGATALMPAIARDILHTDAMGLGLLRGAPAVGAMITTFFLSRILLRYHTGRVLFSSVVVFGLATIIFGVSTHLGLSIAALIVLGAADMLSVIIRNTLVQLETPDAMRGRVSAINSLCIGASNQLGEFESGVTAAIFGLGPSIIIGGGASLLVAFLWHRWFPALRERRELILAPKPP